MVARRYYKLWFDDNDSEAMISVEWDLKTVDPYFAFKRERIHDWPLDVPTFVTRGNHRQDYLEGSANGWELFSRSVVDIFNRLKIDGVDFHPVRIVRSEDNTELTGYFAMHIWNIVSALDLQNAGWEEVGKEGSKRISVYRPVLRMDKIIHMDIFRLEEEVVLEFVSDSIKKAITSEKLTGFKFLSVKTL